MRPAEPPFPLRSADEPGPVASVDLDALGRNVDRLRRCAPSADLLVAVKADAYGHGLLPVARALSRHGVRWFGVATPAEALALRRAGLRERVLLFGPVRGRILERLVANEVDLTVTSEDDVAEVERAVRAVREGASARSGDGEAPPARLHLKVDTGMGRLGRSPAEAAPIASRIDGAEGCEFTAAWTHFACADEPSSDETRRQLDRFHDALSALDASGLEPRLRHAANSAALLTLPESHFDLVRPGIAAYGHHGSDEVAEAAPDLEPILTLTAPVVFVKRVAAGDAVSYGHRWRAQRDTTIATVRIGYGDGYPRALTNRGEARFGDVAGRVAGTVCMDQTMFEVEDDTVEVGDRAVLLSPGGPDARRAAASIGTIPYELITRLTGRVARRYVARGRPTAPP